MHQFLKFIFGIKLRMFRTVPLPIIMSFFALHTAMVYVIQVLLTACEQDQEEPVPSWSCSQAVSKTCMLYHCCVYSEKLMMIDRGTVWNMQSFVPKINLRNYWF